MRMDHRASRRPISSSRASATSATSRPVTPLPDGSGNITTGAIGRTDTRAQAAVASYIRIFRPRAVNELRVGYTRRAVDRTALLLDGTPSRRSACPASRRTRPSRTRCPPSRSTASSSSARPPTRSPTPHRRHADRRRLPWQRGRHSLKVGVDFRLERLEHRAAAVADRPLPLHDARARDLPGTTGTGPLARQLPARPGAELLDRPAAARAPPARADPRDSSPRTTGDATSRLTLNAGLRYTLNFPSTEVDDQSAIFNLETQQLDYPGRDGYPRSARELHWDNFGPRLGVAYHLGAKTVVRSGYAPRLDRAGGDHDAVHAARSSRSCRP